MCHEAWFLVHNNSPSSMHLILGASSRSRRAFHKFLKFKQDISLFKKQKNNQKPLWVSFDILIFASTVPSGQTCYIMLGFTFSVSIKFWPVQATNISEGHKVQTFSQSFAD